MTHMATFRTKMKNLGIPMTTKTLFTTLAGLTIQMKKIQDLTTMVKIIKMKRKPNFCMYMRVKPRTFKGGL